MEVYNKKLIQKGEHYVLQEYLSYNRVKGKPQKQFYRPKDDLERVEIIFDKITPKKIYYESTITNAYVGVDYDIEDYEFEEYYKKAQEILSYNKYKNRCDSVRRSRNKVLDYAMCNPQLSTFITLTYSENMVDYIKLDEDFKKFRNRLNMYMKRNHNKKLEFIATFERQKRGAWHVHMLTNIKKEYFSSITGDVKFVVAPRSKIKTESRKIIEQEFNNKFWGNGFCDYVELPDNNGTALYLSKYMTKTTDDIMLEENIKSRYRVSKGLNVPIEITEKVEKEKPSEVVAILDGLNKDNYFVKTTFYEDYTTEIEKLQGVKKIIKETKYYKKIDEKLVSNNKNNKDYKFMLTCPKNYCNILT